MRNDPATARRQIDIARTQWTRTGFHLQHYYAPTGDLSFPMLTLHTTRDPVVPVFHQTLYGSIAPAEWLVQRTVNAFGHCTFTQQQMLTAFDDLVLWVNEGVRPAGS